MTPEQVCEVLVKAGVLHRYGESFMRAGEPFAVSPDQAVIDGNVAMAAWEAVASKAQALRIDRSDCIVLDVWWDGGSRGQYKVEGIDTAAFTTACAMALAEAEE